MSDIIQLLPDSVANQIAAGEVIQRPASVIKELVENAVDAGANEITIIIKDAGRTLIQVIDNGRGMSETDARMAFERHATSKIRQADDLFAIRSMGFRGEALASVAAIAEICLQTRREGDELGTSVTVKATNVIEQCPVACAKGANFAVKNLFFNVPARRKFLKSDAYEFRLMVSELEKIALANPQTGFTLHHNNTEVARYAPGNIRQRIGQVCGKNTIANLVAIQTDTSIVKISGFIGKPELAKKSGNEQFLFVNNRFMKSSYFHKAILLAYDRIIGIDMQPWYFIFFEINPSEIDVNIHPTKTEIKFAEEPAIWQILHACTKESLGKFNVAPSLDFNTEAAIEIPIITKNTEIRIPGINVNPNFNPFDNERENNFNSSRPETDYFKRNNTQHWETLFAKNEQPESDKPEQQTLYNANSSPHNPLPGLLQLKNRYILAPAKSGLMIIDQKRAHERILFEQFIEQSAGDVSLSQQTLFPQVIELQPADFALFSEYMNEINNIGFDIRHFGNHSIVINGCPANISNPDATGLLNQILFELHNHPQKAGEHARETAAAMLARAAAIPYGKVLSAEEMHDLVDRLFACGNHNFCPAGKPIISILEMDEVEKRLK